MVGEDTDHVEKIVFQNGRFIIHATQLVSEKKPVPAFGNRVLWLKPSSISLNPDLKDRGNSENKKKL